MFGANLSQSKKPPDTAMRISWLDRQFSQVNLLLVIGLPFLFTILFPIVWVLSGVTAFASKLPVARRRAAIVFWIHSSIIVVVFILAIIVLHDGSQGVNGN